MQEKDVLDTLFDWQGKIPQHDWAKHRQHEKTSEGAFYKTSYWKLSQTKKQSNCYIVQLVNDDLQVMTSPKEKRSLQGSYL